MGNSIVTTRGGSGGAPSGTFKKIYERSASISAGANFSLGSLTSNVSSSILSGYTIFFSRVHGTASLYKSSNSNYSCKTVIYDGNGDSVMTINGYGSGSATFSIAIDFSWIFVTEGIDYSCNASAGSVETTGSQYSGSSPSMNASPGGSSYDYRPFTVRNTFTLYQEIYGMAV